MKTTVTKFEFVRWYQSSDGYKNNFSHAGLEALFDYIENLEDDTGESVEFDPIAFACEYSEHATALECAKQYGQFEQEEQTEEYALEWLEEQTQVIEIEGSDSIIIRDF